MVSIFVIYLLHIAADKNRQKRQKKTKTKTNKDKKETMVFIYFSYLLHIASDDSNLNHYPEEEVWNLHFIFLSIQGTGCLKKTEFYQIEHFQICHKYHISISSHLEAGSPKAQFGKTQFFLRHPVVFVLICSHLPFSFPSPN